jgi:hypothetical protein
LVIGADAARFGDDRFSLAWRRGRKVSKIESRTKVDTVAGANWIKQVIDVDKRSSRSSSVRSFKIASMPVSSERERRVPRVAKPIGRARVSREVEQAILPVSPQARVS